MTSSPATTGSQLASRFGLSDRIFVGPAARRLARTLEDGLTQVESAIAEELASADPLVDASARYLYEAGGKRVRPMLVLLTAQLGDGMTPAVRDVAVALELMHLGTLYHDDVMDSADARRGVPSVHRVWNNSTAILIGDLLLSRASRVLGRHGAEAVDMQTTTFERLVIGQLHETVGAGADDDPIRLLPAGARRQDRLPHRRRRTVRRVLRERARRGARAASRLRREGGRRLSSSPTTSSTCPTTPTTPERCPAPTCVRVS